MIDEIKTLGQLFKADPLLKRIYALFEDMSESRRRDLAAIARAMVEQDKQRTKRAKQKDRA
jgi:hypothetical protein